MSIRELLNAIGPARKPAKPGDVLTALAPPAEALPSAYRSALQRSLRDGARQSESSSGAAALADPKRSSPAIRKGPSRPGSTDEAPRAQRPQQDASTGKSSEASTDPARGLATDDPSKQTSIPQAETPSEATGEDDGRTDDFFSQLDVQDSTIHAPANFPPLIFNVEQTAPVAEPDLDSTQVPLRPPAGLFEAIAIPAALAPASDDPLALVPPEAAQIGVREVAPPEDVTIVPTDSISPSETPTPVGPANQADPDPESRVGETELRERTFRNSALDNVSPQVASSLNPIESPDAAASANAGPQDQIGQSAAPKNVPRPESDAAPATQPQPQLSTTSGVQVSAPLHSEQAAQLRHRESNEDRANGAEQPAGHQSFAARPSEFSNVAASQGVEVPLPSPDASVEFSPDDSPAAERRSHSPLAANTSAAGPVTNDSARAVPLSAAPPVPLHDPQALVERTAELLRMSQQSQQPLRVRLHPPELGAMQVEVSLRGGVVHAHIEVSTVAAQQTVLEHLSSLRESLAHHGTIVDRIDVQFVESQPSESQRDPQQRQQQEQPQQQQQQSGDHETLPDQAEAGSGADETTQPLAPSIAAVEHKQIVDGLDLQV